MKKIKILFAEDHEMVRNGINLMLANQKQFQAEITEAGDGIEALQLASRYKYDVFLLDISLPLKDGIEVTRILKTKIENAKIIALTMHKEDYIIKEAIEAGVLGYVLKSSGIEDLTREILTVNQGKRYYSNDVSQIIMEGNSVFSETNLIDRLTPLKEKFKLSAREMQVLKYISEGFTDKQLSEKLGISARTAGNHRFNIGKKMNVKSSVELASIALKYGLV